MPASKSSCHISDTTSNKSRGKKPKSPKQRAAKHSLRGRPRGKAMKALFGLFHTKSSKNCRIKNREEQNSSLDKDKLVFNDNLSFPDQPNSQTVTDHNASCSRHVETREINHENDPMYEELDLPPFLTPPKRRKKSAHNDEERLSRSWSHSRRDLSLVHKLCSLAPSSGRVQNAGDQANTLSGEGNDSVILDESYFEDDYWLTYNDLCDEETSWEDTPPLFSTPSKPGDSQRSPPRVHMGVSSLKLNTKSKTLPLECVGSLDSTATPRRAVKRKYSSLPSRLDMVGRERPSCSPGEHQRATKRRQSGKNTALTEPGTSGRPSLSDEDIENLSPLHPEVGMNLVFETSLEESTIRHESTAEDPVDTMVRENNLKKESEEENVQGNPQISRHSQVTDNVKDEVPKYKSKKPTSLEIIPPSDWFSQRFRSSFSVEEMDSSPFIENNSKNEGATENPDARPNSMESGYDSCGKTPLTQTCSPPDTADQQFFPPSRAPSPSPSTRGTSSLRSTRPSSKENLVTEESSAIPEGRRAKDPPTSTKKSLAQKSKACRSTAVDSCYNSQEENWPENAEVVLQQKQSPIKRSLDLSIHDLDSTPVAEGQGFEGSGQTTDSETSLEGTLNKERCEARTSPLPYLSDSCDENNNYVRFDANTLYQRLTDLSDEHFSTAASIPSPISTSSPLQKKFGEKNVNELNSRGKEQPSMTSCRKSLTAGSKRSSPQDCDLRMAGTSSSARYSPSKKTRTPEKHAETGKTHSSKHRAACTISGTSRASRTDINNNPVLVVPWRNRRLLNLHDMTSSDEEESEMDDVRPGKTSPSSRDYLLIKQTADRILRRIPDECLGADDMDIVRVMGFLHQHYQRELRPSPSRSFQEGSSTPNSSWKQNEHFKILAAVRTVTDLKEAYDQMFEKIPQGCLTISNCIDFLLAAMLVNRNDVVDECLDFAFYNLRELSKKIEFRACPPEVALLLLSNKRSMILGVHGFPLSYEDGEREVLMAAREYCIRHRTGDRQADRQLRDMLVSAADSQIWERQRMIHLYKAHGGCDPETADKNSCTDRQPTRTSRQPCRKRYDIVFHQTGTYAKVDVGSLQSQLVPDVASNRSNTETSSQHEKDRGTNNSPPPCYTEWEDSQDGLCCPNNGCSSMERMRDEQRIFETCTNKHKLHQICFSYQQRKGEAYITGLQLSYIFQGQIQRIAIGNFQTCTQRPDTGRNLPGPGNSIMTNGSRLTSNQPRSGRVVNNTIPTGVNNSQRQLGTDGDSHVNEDTADDPKPRRTVLRLDWGEHVVFMRLQCDSGRSKNSLTISLTTG